MRAGENQRRVVDESMAAEREIMTRRGRVGTKSAALFSLPFRVRGPTPGFGRGVSGRVSGQARTASPRSRRWLGQCPCSLLRTRSTVLEAYAHSTDAASRTAS
jgi:hypothetical protein